MYAKMMEIIARMRKDAEEDDYTPDGVLGQSLHEYADEIEKVIKDVIPPDAGKMLEALKHIKYYVGEGVAGRIQYTDFLLKVRKEVLQALPPEKPTLEVKNDS